MSTNTEEFGDIRPYTDEEAVEALGRVSRHPMMPVISKYLFSDLPASTLSHMLRGIGSIDQFQDEVMLAVIDAVLAKTSDGLSCSGVENLRGVNGRFLAVSNHRDIVMDPALIQHVMRHNGFPFTEICVGSNLLTSQLIVDLMRSNRMIKVIRGIGARELYLSSQLLSQYIRETIVSGRASIWSAQREGRKKNGLDTTEQVLLKMFDMKNPPDAIFGINDEVAIGALYAVKEKGLKIPEDVAIVGFSNSRRSSYIEPTLSTLDQNPMKIGVLAAKLLFDQIQGKPDFSENKEVIVPATLIVRASSNR